MTECTTCPDASVETVPPGPIRCSCCGHPIELTCKGKCDPSHITQSIRAAAPLNSAQRLPAPHGTRARRTYRPKPCRGCPTQFTPTGPRDVFCPDCKRKTR